MDITMTEDPNRKGKDLYYKLHKCLRRAMEEEKLSCHINDIIVNLAKSITSNVTWYDDLIDVWCDYFLRSGKKEMLAGHTVFREDDEVYAIVKNSSSFKLEVICAKVSQIEEETITVCREINSLISENHEFPKNAAKSNIFKTRAAAEQELESREPKKRLDLVNGCPAGKVNHYGNW